MSEHKRPRYCDDAAPQAGDSRLDAVEATVQLASKSIEERWEAIDQVHEDVNAKLHDLRFEGDKLLENLGRNLLEQRNFITQEINRGMKDNAHTRRVFMSTMQQLMQKK